ncbi:MAG: LacI family DNA-binding transcriptional regulator [Solirubrobacteraceae bacterium]|nr:LacI family DNA-binding transcriptional regulator [Solirubrobacteraceae bacterium]
MSAPTSRDIAREAGVSQSTVSRALRRDPRVSEDTLLKVQEVADRLGYVTNRAARALKMRRSHTVGIVVADLRNPYFLEVVDGLHDELHIADYRTFLLTDRLDYGRGADLIDVLRGSVDGVIFASARSADSAPVGLAQHGLPVVLINREVEGHELDRVLSDYATGGALAARHLVELGHKRIGLITGPSKMAVFHDRERAFRAELERLGVPFDERLRREGVYTHQVGSQWCADLMRQTDPPTAIFAADDVVAFGALDAALQLGLRVPDDLSIIGYDDIEMAGWETFGLTTIRQPMTDMAREAARILLQRMGGHGIPDEPQRRVYPASLVRRSSTGPAPV